ncbi:hypothetical protein OG824_35030 [Streptomyces prunicolor]|nr:hypothetical protein [Streptomyces prunicolor]MCX5240438.1 hypothetical protein [Streptomyces prunicolor]
MKPSGRRRVSLRATTASPLARAWSGDATRAGGGEAVAPATLRLGPVSGA